MSTNYEPTAEQVRRLKDELTDGYGCTVMDEHAVMVLQRQHSREKGAMRVLDNLLRSDPLFKVHDRHDERKMGAYEGLAVAEAALKNYFAALDAAPEPTAEDVYRDILALTNSIQEAVARAKKERAK